MSGVFSSRLGSLLLLFQRSPLVQMLFPEARVLGGAGLGEIAKWSVAVIAGLGAYDSVAGATTLAQVAPVPNSTTVPATNGVALSFVFQCTGTESKPKSWTVTGTIPNGLTHANATNNTIDSITGIPTQTGSFPITVKAWEGSNGTGNVVSKSFTINVAANPSAVITTNPSSVTINSGQTTTLNVTASGTGPLTYRWYRGVSGNTNNPVGINAASFTTPALSVTTSYWVNVSNASNPGGDDSNTATVTVKSMLGIEQPEGRPLANGSATIDFGNVAVGGSPSIAVIIRNNGLMDLDGLAITKSGADSDEFVVTGPLATTLATDGMTTFNIQFIPADSTPKTADIRIASNVAGEEPFDIHLTGSGIDPVPEITVMQPAGSDLKDGKAKKSFGTATVGATGMVRKFTIKNTGSANLTGISVALDGAHAEDFIVSAPAKSTLKPGASTTFTVTIKPGATGIHNAAIHVTSNDADENPFDIKLSGLGAAP
jgi:hypothetical protein